MREKKYFFGVLMFTDEKSSIRRRIRILDPLFRDNRGSGSGTQTKPFKKDGPYQNVMNTEHCCKERFCVLDHTNRDQDLVPGRIRIGV
jgi:hypothetical protein